MTIDTHLHVWDLGRASYPWLTSALDPINRSFALDEALPQLAQAGIDGVILVQAANSVADSQALFAVQSPLVCGVVAWIDLLHPAEVDHQMDRWSEHRTFVGVRHLIHNEPDPDWLARATVRRSLAHLAARNLAYDVVAVLPRHLEHARAIADEMPELRLIIDHLGTPPVGASSREPWTTLIRDLSRRPNVFVKLSGLTTLGSGSATSAALQPYVDLALDAFGPERLMYGGDWPVSTLAAPYASTWATANELLLALSPDERRRVLDLTARRAYVLGPSRADENN